MSEGFGWTPNPFLQDFEWRDDGCLIIRPRTALAPYPRRMMDRLEHWAAVAPERIFVARRDAGGDWTKLTYRQTLERVRRIAAGLITRNLSAERPIAILSGNSIEHLLLAFAATWAGIPYSPVSPSYSLVAGDFGKLRFVLELLTPGMVVAFDTPKFTRALNALTPADTEIVGDIERIDHRKITQFAALDAQPDAALDEAHARTGPDSIVKFLLTSGSTGEPKAVITTERMLCSNAVMLREAIPFVVDTPPVILDWLPWNHTFGGSHNVGLVLFNGGSLYINDGKPTPAGFAETARNLREISPTVYFDVPKGYEMLAQEMSWDSVLRKKFYERLQAYFFAAAGLSQHVWDALDAHAMTEWGVKIPMLSGLGATETGPSVTFTTPGMGRSGVIGLPAAGNLVKLVPVEGKLEIRVRSPSITPGYWRRPQLSAAAFDEEGFYRLGDAVRLLDSQNPNKGMAFDGRIAEDFKLASGTWVSVGPLRASLLAALAPLIQDVVIAGLNEDYLTALVIPDVRACAAALQQPPTAGYEVIAALPELRNLLRKSLQAHAAVNPASSTHIERAMVLPTSPDLGVGEITDKGSLNQRAVLRHRAALVRRLYASHPDADVICV
jgi:feruloyl-CoA synthase